MTASAVWFRKPAERFEEAIPVGAGRFGAMLYGAPDCELLRLNEDSVWSGGPRERINPDAKEGFLEIRKLIRQQRISEAEQLAFQKMQGCPPNMRHYMPLGDLSLRLTLPKGEITDYRRELNLETGVYSVEFCLNGAHFRREIIASYPAQCLLIHLTADIPFDVSAAMDGRDDYYDNNRIVLHDGVPYLEFDGGSGTENGIHFACAVTAQTPDGFPEPCGNTLTVTCTKDVTFALTVRTSYYHPGADCTSLARHDLLTALPQYWDALRSEHIRDYRSLYARCEISLPENKPANDIPTDELLKMLQNGDNSVRETLLNLYFRFGRYLMIAGSRPGSLPLNLQGIWNVDMWPAWGSRFTVNINTQMNYWAAESCNLSECHLPLFDLLTKIAENGRKTASQMYSLRGFCCHHNTDLWGDTAPQDLWMPATLWATGGAWLSLHIMEHFRFTQDIAFLQKYYPILHDAALFCSDFLTENAEGRLVTNPGVSPENTYLLPDGSKGCLCEGASMDSQIITALFQDVLDAEQLLGLHSPLADTIRQQLPRIPKPQIGRYGQIMEWAVDYEEAEPGHRHISQLFALHPAHQITVRRTPELAKAAAATLKRRLTYGGGHTGWSCAWIANMYARLHDGEQVLGMLTKLLTGSTCPNLFDLHPPFQIDGNFGGTAAIAECLLQSDPDGILLLPACPKVWHSGRFHGLCAAGGFEISAEWNQNRLSAVTVHSRFGGTCRILSPNALHLQPDQQTITKFRKEADGLMQFETVSGGVYHLTAE